MEDCFPKQLHHFTSHQQRVKFPITPSPCQQLVVICPNIPAGVRWHLIVVWVGISLMTNDAEHLFMQLLAPGVSSLEKCAFKSIAHFSVGSFVFCCWVIRVLNIFWIQVPYQIRGLEISSPILWIPFTFSMASFGTQKFLLLMKSSLTFLLLPVL